MFARIFIIINHKGTKFKQAFRMFSRVLGNAEGKVNRKRAAFSFFTLDIDVSAHQIDQVMSDYKMFQVDQGVITEREEDEA